MAKIRVPKHQYNPLPLDNTFVSKPNIMQPNFLPKEVNGFEPGTLLHGNPNNPRLIKIKTYYPQKGESIPITDQRTIDNVTGMPIKDSSRFNVKADKEVLQDIISSAKSQGVDPYTAVAMALQETNLSPYGDNEGNPFHAWGDVNVFGKTDKESVDNSIKALKEKFAYADKLGKKTEAEKIQAWNGYGKIGKNTEGRQSSFYGIDVTQNPIDLNINPVYGKRVIDLRDNVIKKNPNLVKMIESL